MARWVVNIYFSRAKIVDSAIEIFKELHTKNNNALDLSLMRHVT